MFVHHQTETFYGIQSKRNTQNKARDLSGAFSFFAFSTLGFVSRRDVWMSLYDIDEEYFLDFSPACNKKLRDWWDISRISKIIYDKLRLRGVFSFEFWNFINEKLFCCCFMRSVLSDDGREITYLYFFFFFFSRRRNSSWKSTAGLSESPSTSSRIYYSVFIGPRCEVTTFSHVYVLR